MLFSSRNRARRDRALRLARSHGAPALVSRTCAARRTDAPRPATRPSARAPRPQFTEETHRPPCAPRPRVRPSVPARRPVSTVPRRPRCPASTRGCVHVRASSLERTWRRANEKTECAEDAEGAYSEIEVSARALTSAKLPYNRPTAFAHINGPSRQRQGTLEAHHIYAASAEPQGRATQTGAPLPLLTSSTLFAKSWCLASCDPPGRHRQGSYRSP